MIRQKKSKQLFQRNSIKFQQFQQSQIVKQNNSFRHIDKYDKQNLYEDSLLNKFFNLNINAQNAINYTKNGRKRQLIKSQRPFLLFREDKNRSQQGSVQDKYSQNKQNKHMTKQQQNKNKNKSNNSNSNNNIINSNININNSNSNINSFPLQQNDKKTLIQTTGNIMLSFKSFKKKQYISRLKRPISSNPTSRSSMQLDGFDNSISRILGEIKNQQIYNNNLQNNNNMINKDKISTSKAIQMFSKVVRSNQNTSREVVIKKVNLSNNYGNNNGNNYGKSEKQRYKSVSVLANKVKIQHKQHKNHSNNNNKVDFKTYVKKFKNIKKKTEESCKQNIFKTKQQDFNIQGWDTEDNYLF